MKDRVQSGMVTCLPDRVPARGATTMTRMHRLAKPYHGSGRACPCHVSPTYSPTSRIRQQSPSAAKKEKKNFRGITCPPGRVPSAPPAEDRSPLHSRLMSGLRLNAMVEVITNEDPYLNRGKGDLTTWIGERGLAEVAARLGGPAGPQPRRITWAERLRIPHWVALRAFPGIASSISP